MHRDIKPSNVWIDSKGGEVKVKILDFGLARAQAPESVQCAIFAPPTTALGRTVLV